MNDGICIPSTCRMRLKGRESLGAGYAHAHLQRWVAAAVVVQRAVRTWRFRLHLCFGRAARLRMLQAITNLQALWRARKPLRSFKRLRSAAVTLQVLASICVKGHVLVLG